MACTVSQRHHFPDISCDVGVFRNGSCNHYNYDLHHLDIEHGIFVLYAVRHAESAHTERSTLPWARHDGDGTYESNDSDADAECCGIFCTVHLRNVHRSSPCGHDVHAVRTTCSGIQQNGGALLFHISTRCTLYVKLLLFF